MSGLTRTANGSFKSDGASKDVKTVGFRPAKVELYCSGGDSGVWLESMADASVHKRVAGGTGSLSSSNGITPLASGFTIGADADLNANGETVHWWASE